MEALVMAPEASPKIKAEIDSGYLCPMGLIQIRPLSPADLGKNHQVLAYGYEFNGSKVTPHVYDPNEDVSTGDQVKPSLNIGFTDRVIDVQRTSRFEHPVICFLRKDFSVRRPLWVHRQCGFSLREKELIRRVAFGLMPRRCRREPPIFDWFVSYAR
jgi:hypothetical protein